MAKPRVSVVIPFRNAAKTILEAVESILDQDFSDLELIVVDDGSTDGSVEHLAAIDDPRLIRCRNKRKPGVVGATNTGMDEAEGEWIARMDADDFSLRGRLRKQLAAAGKDADVVTCGVDVIDSCGEGMERYVAWVNSLGTHSLISSSRFIESPVINPASMIRRECLEQAGGYRDTAWAEDHDLWLRLLEKGCLFASAPKISLHWRDSPERLTRRDPRYGARLRSRMRAHYLARLPGIRSAGVVIAGAGPIGKRLARDLLAEGVEVRGFLEVNPRQIGQRIHDIPVVSADKIGRWGSSVLLGAVGLEGGRQLIRKLAISSGRREGVDFWAVC